MKMHFSILSVSMVMLLSGVCNLFATPGKVSPQLQQAIAAAENGELITAWIFFRDKGEEVPAKLRAAEQSLGEHAYERRLRTRGAANLLDEHDLPVEKLYLKQVRSKAAQVRQQSRWLNAISVEASAAALNEIAGMFFVKRLELLHSLAFDMPTEAEALPVLDKGYRSGKTIDYGTSWTQNNQIRVPELHNLGFDGSGVVIALLDAGFNNLQHEAISHVNIVAAWDFVNGDSVVSDEPGQMGSGNHGTYILSTIAGFADTKLIGPAYNADYLLAKTENTDWERHIEEDAWVAAAEWADSLGADIISSSLGYRFGFTNGEQDYTSQDMDGNTAIITIGADLAASRGILVVTSAGNDGTPAPGENTIGAPADGDSVMAIGAVTSSGIRATFSSMGATADGRIKPDVMAMGAQTLCASATNPTGYLNLNGTSLSCPLAAGAAALVLQANPSLTNMDIVDALRSTADNTQSPNNQYGWGIIDAYSAAFFFTGISGETPSVAKEFELLPAYPNPFNPATTIRYRLQNSASIDIRIYSVLGQQVETLFSGVQGAGDHQLEWQPQDLSSGVYYLRIKSGTRQAAQKLVLIR